MLAGLIFATEEADDRPDALAATLPFGGMTLLEYQARLLAAAGVGHILVAVGRVTPALLGAVSRIAHRDIAVDVVRSAEEAAARAHPLASMLVVADGLVTTDVAVRYIAGENPDTILVTPDVSTAAVERVDAENCWAGLACVSSDRLRDIAALPREYDFQSTLLRVVVQAGAKQQKLPQSARRSGHGIERNSQALASRSNAVLAALANQRIGWADRYVFTPITRLALPWLVRKGVPNWATIAIASALMMIAVVVMVLLPPAVGIGAALLSVACFSTGSLLSWLRGDDRRARLQEATIVGLCALVALVLGGQISLETARPTAIILAIVAVAAAAVAERVPVRRRPWYGNAASYLLLLAPFAIGGLPIVGLGAIALYALVTLAMAVEASRKDA